MYFKPRISPTIKRGIELKITKACGEIFINSKKDETINSIDNIKTLILSILITNIKIN